MMVMLHSQTVGEPQHANFYIMLLWGRNLKISFKLCDQLKYVSAVCTYLSLWNELKLEGNSILLLLETGLFIGTELSHCYRKRLVSWLQVNFWTIYDSASRRNDANALSPYDGMSKRVKGFYFFILFFFFFTYYLFIQLVLKDNWFFSLTPDLSNTEALGW